jgi:hypothetical protein
LFLIDEKEKTDSVRHKAVTYATQDEEILESCSYYLNSIGVIALFYEANSNTICTTRDPNSKDTIYGDLRMVKRVSWKNFKDC